MRIQSTLANAASTTNYAYVKALAYYGTVNRSTILNECIGKRHHEYYSTQISLMIGVIDYITRALDSGDFHDGFQ
jgi:hypothetical protein